MEVRRVLILGGYGNFGKRIAENLSTLAGVVVLIAGRNIQKSRQLCEELTYKGGAGSLEAVAVDIFSPHLVEELRCLSPDLVIHTGGPFQGQDYRVPEACITLGSHYVDLADDRRFVCDITSLNDQALKNNVLVVSGASSVPGLSSTVIDHFASQFSVLDEIDFAIAPGNQAERGEATVKGILSYTGHPFSVFAKGEWVDRYGWMSPRRLHFGEAIGKRWLANVDIPDLELFPNRYQAIKTVNFQAGLELPFLHLGMVFMAWLAKIGLIKDWSVFTRPIFKSSELFKGLGTDIGGMQINIRGLDLNQKPKHIKWLLCAEKGVGPYIPILSAIIIAKKLIAGDIDTTGAMPCLGMYSLAEFDKEASPLGIYHYMEGDIG
jgi:saccharopine dehydrogenase-like NADP-dependent oxidoreductase